MTKDQYKQLRKSIGTWEKVAEMLGVSWRTIARRESGEISITKAAEIAIRKLEPTWFSEMPPLPALEGEEIRHVPGWPGYAATDMGRVFGCRSKHPHPEFPYEAWSERLSTKGQRGYWLISFQEPGKARRQFKLHQVVLMTFVGPKPDGFVGCHYDDNKDNNTLPNLRWGTLSDNRRDMLRNGHMPDRKGHKHPMAKLTPADVEEIKRLRANGLTLREIGNKFGITEGQVSLIYRGKTWKHTFKHEQKSKGPKADHTATAH